MKRIAVIRLSAMGDVALSVPVLLAFTQQYRDIKVVVVTRKLYAPIFAHIPNCEVCFANTSTEHKGILGLFRLYRTLKSRGVTQVADLHSVLRTHILRLFFTIAKIPFIQLDKNRSEKRKLVRAEQKVFAPLPRVVDKYAEVFAKLGYPISLEKNYFLPKETLSMEVRKYIREDKKRIGIAPFASFAGKEYPFDQMKHIILALAENKDNQIYIFGGGEREYKLAQSIHAPNVMNCIAKFSFKEDLQFISNLDIMVAMDSGNAHLSAMYGVPTLTIWGVTHPYAGFFPYAQPETNALLADRTQFPLIPTSIFGKKYPKGYENAIKTISETSIIEKIYKILSDTISK